jgi:hypothetical protein
MCSFHYLEFFMTMTVLYLHTVLFRDRAMDDAQRTCQFGASRLFSRGALYLVYSLTLILSTPFDEESLEVVCAFGNAYSGLFSMPTE